MDFDDALAAIATLERLWRERRGHVTLADLGLASGGATMRRRGETGAVPEQWRRYPGVVTARRKAA